MSDVKSELLGIKILVEGKAGCGKTHALKTLKDSGLDVYGLWLDPGYQILGEDLSWMHWRYVKPATTNWKTLISNAEMINRMSNKSLQDLQGINQTDYRQFIDILNQCADFKDNHGKSWGDISEWGTGKILLVDNLSPLSDASKNLTVGAKPVVSQPDWGVMMDNLERLIKTWCYGLRCHFVLLSHIEPEKDETNGNVVNYASTLGRKLAPKLPALFDEVLLSYRDSQNNFFWSNTSSNADVKKRHLAFGDKHPQDYRLILNAWKAKGGIIEPS